jgi:hypothetical protein
MFIQFGDFELQMNLVTTAATLTMNNLMTNLVGGVGFSYQRSVTGNR